MERLAQDRRGPLDDIGVLDVRVGGQRADSEAIAVLDVAQALEAANADEDRRPDEALLHHDQQAGATRQDLGVVTVLVQ